MIKIAHISDIHIRNTRFHENYREVFNKTFKQLKEDEVDLIFVLGDIAHTKINLSAEFFDMTHYFFKGLSKISPVYCILGNHDANLANLDRQDSVTPVIDAMQDSNVNLIKFTGKVPVKEFPIDIYHYSLFDIHNWPESGFEVDKSRISICMYHGPLDGCVTDAGFKMDYKINKSMFDPYDYTMLGDIHLCQPMDKDKRIWYAGSLIQQNYGETYDKGYLLWKIQDGNNWEVERKVISNPEPFVTAIVEDKSLTMNHPNPPEGCRLRFDIKDELSVKELNEIISPVITQLKPKEKRVRRATSAIKKIEEARGTEDYRSASVQAQLLREFCAERGVDNKVTEKVININNELCSSNESSEILRNITFDIENIEWSNMFSYGEDNKIELKNIYGLIGIFGPNATGKSSVVDSLLFSMFNKVSRKVPSIGNVINNRKNESRTSITLSSGNQKYNIDRKAQWKKNKGIEKGSCSVSVDFSEDNGDGFIKNNGQSRPDTDGSIIRPRIGEFEDYITTSISPQGFVSKFLELGAADRKDYLINILDIAFFDKQFELAKLQSKPLKAMISTLGEPGEIKNEIKDLRIQESTCDLEVSLLDEKLIKLNKEEVKLLEKIKIVKEAIESAGKPRFNLSKLKNEKSDLENKILNFKNEIEENIEEFNNLNNFVKNIKIEKPDSSRLDELTEKIKLWKEAENTVGNILDKIKILEKQSSTLKQIPCGDSFPQCPLISNAHSAKNEAQKLSASLEGIAPSLPSEKEKEEASGEITSIKKAISEYEELKNKKERSESRVKLLNAEMTLKLERLENIQKRFSEIDFEIKEAEKEEELILNISNLMKEESEINKELSDIKNKKKESENLRSESLKNSAKFSAKIDILEEQYLKLKSAIEDYEAYEHLISGLSRNGIVQKVLENMQDAINIEIQDILSDIVPFTVTFDLSDPNCKMYIEYPEMEKRYLELASGMEKMISSLAVRVALIQLSSLPKLSTLVIDESFGALDPENINAMGKMFESLKSKFKNIIIISHIDSIKDMVDYSITIEVDKNGYSKLIN